jgi:hypothetical protein
MDPQTGYPEYLSGEEFLGSGCFEPVVQVHPDTKVFVH